ncbi:hypothetical protein VC83_03693 [Pseudogymnoascus destructans]|uniref:Transmembrane protein n=1 Tax=Pseudogymnoascus destructans TaxID=655981 RepID=A0A177ACJ9_9PEZI|nr:uncharacterized protein VC83_03693 [Pseudogymnoascus destructans]OAF59839.1 hypothetical protein VC83_03693 [Pseudogymnoascus destructans]
MGWGRWETGFGGMGNIKEGKERDGTGMAESIARIREILFFAIFVASLFVCCSLLSGCFWRRTRGGVLRERIWGVDLPGFVGGLAREEKQGGGWREESGYSRFNLS